MNVHFTRRQLFVIAVGAALVLAAALAFFLRSGLIREPAAPGYVAVIRIDGALYGGEDAGGLLAQQQGTASERVMRELREARLDPQARAVLLRLNTPGGSAAAAQEIAEEVDKVRSAGKPVVVSMGDLCASAGYWIASRGDYLFASPASLTGSIGVYIDYNNVEELLDELGVYNEKIKSGAHKDILSMFRPMTDDERAMLQRMVDDIYQQFVRTVADGRRMDEADVRALADGRLFTGRQALDAGLVDAVGNYYDALNYAGERAGLGDGDIPVHSYGEARPLAGLFASDMNEMGRRMADGMVDRLTQAAGGAPAVR